MKSFYTYRKRKISFDQNGRLIGGKLRVLISLVDFTFIRSLVADCYSNEGGRSHDPVTVILLDLFAMEEGMTIKDFVKIVNHKVTGSKYHDYAGLPDNEIISEGTFTNVRNQIKKERYNQILHILVQIMTELEFITGEIISIDGTLIPTYSRYKRCNSFCEKCRCIECEGVFQKIRERVEKICSGQDNGLISKENRILIECPNPDAGIPKGKKTKILTEVVCFTIEKNKSNKSGDALAQKIGVNNILSKQGLGLNIMRSNIVNFHPEGKDAVFINCCKIPSDMNAGLGCRRSKDNPDKKEWVFGFNDVIATTVEPLTRLELPIAVISIPGDNDEGDEFIPLMKQIDQHHSFKTKIYLADSGHDYVRNYNAVREKGAIPLIDYNPRNEDQSEEALTKRGYNEKGWPYADCGALMKPNGFDFKAKRIKFCCCHNCPEKLKQSEDFKCEYLKNKTGQVKNMCVKEHPRLILEIPRGTKKYKKNYNNRTASERINSYLKDKCGLRRPLIRGLKSFSIKAIMACVLTLLMKVIDFILETTRLLSKEKCKPPPGKPVPEKKTIKTGGGEIALSTT